MSAKSLPLKVLPLLILLILASIVADGRQGDLIESTSPTGTHAADEAHLSVVAGSIIVAVIERPCSTWHIRAVGKASVRFITASRSSCDALVREGDLSGKPLTRLYADAIGGCIAKMKAAAK
jgi:hypothetical protein